MKNTTNKINGSIPVLYFVMLVMVWGAVELEIWPYLRETNFFNSDLISTFIKSGIVKNIVWTMPALLLARRYRNKMSLSVKEMFTNGVSWRRYLPLFAFFTLFLLLSSWVVNGKVTLSADFRLQHVIISVFAGITEEIVFRGWLLNASLPKSFTPRKIIAGRPVSIAMPDHSPAETFVTERPGSALSVAENVLPKSDAPGSPASESRFPERPGPGLSVAESTLTASAISRSSVAENALPESTMPRFSTSESILPESAISRFSTAEGTLPESVMPEASAAKFPERSEPEGPGRAKQQVQAAVFLNALLFLAIHFPRWIHESIFLTSFLDLSFLCIIALSAIFSLAFIKSRSILVPMALHTYWDLLAFLLL